MDANRRMVSRSAGWIRALAQAALLAGVLSAAALAAELSDPLEPETELGGEVEDTGDHSRYSLYSGPAPRPGPDILYATPPRAPQLENTGIWKAKPILISGASAYRKGEFLYQDFIYDDHGANGGVRDPDDPRNRGNSFSASSGTYTYPSDSRYAGNAADFVEFRVKPHGNDTVFRITLNSLHDPALVAFTIAIGDSAEPRPFPHGANVSAPAQLFLTVFGGQAELRDAASGQLLSPAPTVAVNLERRQFEVRLPNAAWDPADQPVRLAAGVGLWDQANGRYLLPRYSASESEPGGAGTLTQPAAFFNVAFRYHEPLRVATDDSDRPHGRGWWRATAQGRALSAGDISEFHTVVDFGKLKQHVDDDMIGQPQGVPQYGPMNRIFASHFESRQGTAFDDTCGSASSCRGALRGQLQPYAIYVPKKPEPEHGYGLTLLLHSLSGNYNQYSGSRNQSQLGERGRGHIVVTPAGRGPDGWYVDHAAADAFEVWADVARHYRLDPELAAVTGYSMGGYGTFRFATRYPDLFARAFTVVGPPGLGIWVPPGTPSGGDSTNTYHLLPGVRNIPFLMWVEAADELVPYNGTRAQAQRFDEFGYRYRFDTFLNGEHLTLSMHDQYAPGAEFLGDGRVNRNPHHVTYVVNPAMDFPDAGLVGDKAYWLSGLTVRDATAQSGRGSVDAISHGFGVGDPQPQPTQQGAGTLEGDLGYQAYVSEYKTWGEVPSMPVANRLELTASNIATVTVHMKRARLDCDAELDVATDGPLTVTLAGCNRELPFSATN